MTSAAAPSLRLFATRRRPGTPRAWASPLAAVLLMSACGLDPAPPPQLKGEGATCQVSTECSAGLRCVDAVCTAGACRSASDCQGAWPVGCEAWTCISGLCEPLCIVDAGPRPDAAPAPDAAPDAAVTRDAAATLDAESAVDAEPSVDAAPVGLDAVPAVDAAPSAPDATPADSGGATDTGVASDAGARPDATASDAATPADAGVACSPTARAPLAGELLLNEVLADPADGVAGDANLDGTRDQADDEFVELANVSASTLQLGGLVLSDMTGARHVFAPYALACGQVVVVFGGGDTASPSWRSHWVRASTGGLSLNNSGDQVRVGTSTSPASLLSEAYGSAAGNNQSLVRSPELSVAAPFVQHTAHPQAAGRIHSPGVRADGSAF